MVSGVTVVIVDKGKLDVRFIILGDFERMVTEFEDERLATERKRRTSTK